LADPLVVVPLPVVVEGGPFAVTLVSSRLAR
jgi:hypothetical protein